MKAQHTPGPWTQGRVGETQCFDLIGPNVTGRGQEVVGTLRASQSTTIDAANAALIAAAPELLAALQNLVARNLIKDTDDDHYDEVLDAIAKAGGAQ